MFDHFYTNLTDFKGICKDSVYILSSANLLGTLDYTD